MSGIRHETRARTVSEWHSGGDSIDRHRHDDHQLIYVSTGVLAVETAAGSWIASKDRAVWLPAGTWHAHRFFGATTLHAVGFPASQAPLPDTDPAIIPVSSLLRELLVAVADPQLTVGENNRVRAVLRDQLRRAPLQPISLPVPRDPRLADACAIASGEIDRSISLTSLARQVGASERSLSRLFRDELGMTYPQWRSNLRLLHAMVLLSYGTSVTETALQCGWKTTSSFVDAFHGAMGQTPGTYRRAAVSYNVERGSKRSTTAQHRSAAPDHR